MCTKKSVRFDQDITIKEIPKIGKRQHEVRSLYYGKRDYEHFKQNDERMIRRMEESPFAVEGSAKKCTRGLEGRTSIEKERRENIRMESITAVLSEQMVQYELGENNPQLIADAYQVFSNKAALQARKIAKMDENIVLNYATSDDTKEKQTSSLRSFPRFLLRRSASGPLLRRRNTAATNKKVVGHVLAP